MLNQPLTDWQQFALRSLEKSYRPHSGTHNRTVVAMHFLASLTKWFLLRSSCHGYHCQHPCDLLILGAANDTGLTLALGLILVDEGRMGVPSGAVTKLALPQALLPDISGFSIPDAKDFCGPRLGRD